MRGLADGEATASLVGSFEAPGRLALITGGDVAADRHAVVLRTYSGVWLYRLGDGQPVVDALAATPCRGRTSPEVQGEAVGFAPDGRSLRDDRRVRADEAAEPRHDRGGRGLTGRSRRPGQRTVSAARTRFSPSRSGEPSTTRVPVAM